MPPTNMALWHTDYLELKLFENQPVQEGYSDPPLSPREQEMILPSKSCFPCTRRRRDILTSRDREFRAEKSI